ncbi:Galactose oxidase/kelch beta-propeller [Macrophomina phaseolina MS6]|uniref:Galactose oxidase/kelch beta-propeller n=1 Tax=Macrophomina phaseolina (strain MS6) TaxID=1126212 RepID=K2RSW7_MACPH|nr:Galactose oxidase/kelch beta-propeller [Macrophomina phaseolina MS6]
MTRATFLSSRAATFVTLLVKHLCHANGIVGRQADGSASASSFLRRGYHASIVVGDYVYIDSGEFSTYDDGQVDFEYSNTLLSIDLSENWTNSTVTVHSTSKPSSVPSLVHAGLWYDEATDLIYTGFAGRTSTFNASELDPWPMGIWTFKPDGLGSGTWGTALNANAPVFDSITRPYTAAIAHGNRVGYALGGSVTWQTAPDAVSDTSAIVNIDGMLRFDMETQELTNVTVEGPRFHNGHVQYAEMVFVPNFGREGVFLVLGGVSTNPKTDVLDWSTVTVFDPSEGKWYDQKTTGNTPQGRKEFCATGLASDKSTYEIFAYAGWGGDLGTKSVQFDQIYILTLPAFHWINVDYPPTGTRHALTCHAVGGSQILTIGGVDSASTDSSATIYAGPFRDRDKYTQGLAVFDLSTLEWKNEYTANASKYTQSELVRTYYAENRNPSFNSTQLKAVFDATNFTDSASISTTSGSASPESPANSENESEKSLGTAAIAGIAIGAVAGILILGGGLTFLWCTKRRSRQRRMHDQQSNLCVANTSAQEMPGEAVAELPPGQNTLIWELQGGMRNMCHEKDGNTVVAELSGDEANQRGSRKS